MIRMGRFGVPSRIVNPARAGMIPTFSYSQPILMRKPRASGDDPGVILGAAEIPE